LARCVAKGIRDTKLPLRKFLVRDVGAFDPARPDPQATFNLPVTPVPVKTGDVTKVPQT
jgi:hypothetical protein